MAGANDPHVTIPKYGFLIRNHLRGFWIAESICQDTWKPE
jgi:hypothetical protein